MNRRQALTGLAATAAATALVSPSRATAAPRQEHGRDPFPETIQLPDGWLPEGITIGGGPLAYFGSRADGSIFRANLITGEGKVVSQGPGTGFPSVGLKIDGQGRLFVCGGNAGTGRVVNAFNGDLLANYTFTTAASFMNDVVLTPDGPYFTNSLEPAIYHVPLGRGGRLPAPDGFRRIEFTGAEWVQTAGNNANGIVRTPDGRALLTVQSSTGLLFRVDPSTGAATSVDLGGELLTNGDGLLLEGRTLFVVQNRLNTVAKFQLAADGRSGRLITKVTDPRFDVPTTVASFGNRLYLVNARFSTPPTPETTYTAVAIPRP
jgi:sugar lactone lactonase YvrE